MHPQLIAFIHELTLSVKESNDNIQWFEAEQENLIEAPYVKSEMRMNGVIDTVIMKAINSGRLKLSHEKKEVFRVKH